MAIPDYTCQAGCGRDHPVYLTGCPFGGRRPPPRPTTPLTASQQVAAMQLAHALKRDMAVRESQARQEACARRLAVHRFTWKSQREDQRQQAEAVLQGQLHDALDGLRAKRQHDLRERLRRLGLTVEGEAGS